MIYELGFLLAFSTAAGVFRLGFPIVIVEIVSSWLCEVKGSLNPLGSGKGYHIYTTCFYACLMKNINTITATLT